MAEPLDFTIRQIDSLATPSDGRAEYKDTKVQGLYLRVTANAIKTFSFVGRAKGSHRVERLTLGKYPQVKPEEARTRAREIAGRLASGVSVAAASREKKGELTVGELWKLYFAYISKTNKRPEATKVLWDVYVGPQWSKRRLSDISGVDVERWHLDLPDQIMKKREERAAAIKAREAKRREEIKGRQVHRRHGPDPKPAKPARVAKKVTGKVAANNAVELLRAMYSFAKHNNRAYFTGDNPASNHRAFPSPERERFLQPDELAPFFEALAAEPNESMRDAILIALLTGQRRANVLAMRWSEVHLDRAEWRISGELMKNGLPHIAPLGPEALELLRRRLAAKMPKIDYVFPSSRSKSGHLGPPKTAWNRIMDASKMDDLIFHDLRRTLGSWQAREGSSLVLIGKSLNHKTPEATAIYARLDMDPVRQSMQRATSSMFAAAGVKPTADVVDIRGKNKKPAPDECDQDEGNQVGND